MLPCYTHQSDGFLCKLGHRRDPFTWGAGPSKVTQADMRSIFLVECLTKGGIFFRHDLATLLVVCVLGIGYYMICVNRGLNDATRPRLATSSHRKEPAKREPIWPLHHTMHVLCK